MPRRANYRGRKVLFPLGVILVATAGLALTAGLNRSLVFLCGVGYLGLIDDLAGSPASTGAIKAVGTVALAAYAVAGGGVSGAELVLDVLVLALAAHLGNLLDTRPGRSEKGLALTAAVVCLASWSLAALEPIAALMPVVAAGAWLTLRERAMWGDTGASMIGGMIGVLLVTALSPLGTSLVLAGLIAISLYGEFRSISATVERIPPLQRLDSLGRVN